MSIWQWLAVRNGYIAANTSEDDKAIPKDDIDSLWEFTNKE